MNAMLAYCGLNCQSCSIHLATLEQDPVKRKSMRMEIAAMCREQYRMELKVEDITDCDGCRSTNGRLFSGCAKCTIRTCAAANELTSCAYCSEFARERLSRHFQTDPTARVRLESLRKWRESP